MTMARERAEREREAPASPPRPALTVGELRQLIRFMNSTDLEELVIEQESSGLRVVLRKAPAPAAPAVGAAALDLPVHSIEPMAASDSLAAVDSLEPDETGQTERAIEVRAPFVGVFRSNLERAGVPELQPGVAVKDGQIVAAIESLNVLNEVEAPVKGRIKEVLVSDGQAVEYGQVLMVITAAEP